MPKAVVAIKVQVTERAQKLDWVRWTSSWEDDVNFCSMLF